MYTFALLWPPVRVRLLFLFGRDTALAPPRSDCGGRGVFAIFASVLTCPADGPDTIIDTFDLGAPAASAGNAGAHPAWACVGDGPAAALCRPDVDMVAVLGVRRPAGRSEGCNRVGKPSVFALWDVSGVQLMVGRVSGHEADSQDRAEQSSSRGQTADWRQKSARRGAHTKSQLRGVARRYLSKSNGGQARRAAAARRHDRAEDLAIRGHDGRRLKG